MRSPAAIENNAYSGDPDGMGVIFDMHGVLFDALAQLTPSLDRALSVHGVSMDRFDPKYDFMGRPLDAILDAAKEQFGIDIESETFSQDVGNGAIQMMIEEKVVAHTGLVTLLESLKQEGVPMAVGSSSPRWRIEKIITVLGIHDYFATYIGTEDVPEHKPNPHVFLEAAHRLRVAASRCVIIEDAKSGVTAAKRANMKAVGFLKYASDKDSLNDADLLVEDYSEITPMRLRGLLAS
jgi:HAD superfamily hydrolase (TIGR01509 family)